MKKIRQIITLSISLILLIIGIMLYQIRYNPTLPDLNCQIPIPICGTKPLELTEKQYQGKEIFNSNCAVCHKLDSKSTGPVLRDKDSLIFVKWMLKKKHKIDSTKIEKLGIDYHRTKFIDYINEENLPLIINYCSSPRY